MNLTDFKEQLTEKKLQGLYILTGPESFFKQQYIEKAKEDYNLRQVVSYRELVTASGRKSLLGGSPNLLVYVTTVVGLRLEDIRIKDNVVIICSLDDPAVKHDGLVYFPLLNSQMMTAYTRIKNVKTVTQASRLKEALGIIGPQDVYATGLMEYHHPIPTAEEYMLAFIRGDMSSMVAYNYILNKNEVSPFGIISTLITGLMIYQLMLSANNVFQGKNRAFEVGLNYNYARAIQESFIRLRKAGDPDGYSKWIELRNLYQMPCKSMIRKLHWLLSNYIYLGNENTYNYITFCL